MELERLLQRRLFDRDRNVNVRISMKSLIKFNICAKIKVLICITYLYILLHVQVRRVHAETSSGSAAVAGFEPVMEQLASVNRLKDSLLY